MNRVEVLRGSGWVVLRRTSTNGCRVEITKDREITKVVEAPSPAYVNLKTLSQAVAKPLEAAGLLQIATVLTVATHLPEELPAGPSQSEPAKIETG
jgi:hypothetical protein